MEIRIVKRPRRNRRTEEIRALVRETRLAVQDLVMPLFIAEGRRLKSPVPSMPGIYRLSVDVAVRESRALYGLGVTAVAPFPVIPTAKKDRAASESVNEKGLYARAIREIKAAVPRMTLITDVAMDPYSSEGHDGLVDEHGEILNDETLPILAEQAVLQARSGADYVAPSDMMDGSVGVIRGALDAAGFKSTGILAYSAKYASAFYNPFRDALGSAPKRGDKRTYQMDPANAKEAVREALLDVEQGADIVMVKPGLPCLDILRAVSAAVNVPVAVFNVSGEYAVLKAAALKGWIDYPSAVLETLVSLKRAGASMILTYHAKEAARWI